MLDWKTSLAGVTLALGLFGAVAQTAAPDTDIAQAVKNLPGQSVEPTQTEAAGTEPQG